MWRLQNAAAAHLRQIRCKLTTPIMQSIYKRTSVYSPRVSKKYCQSLIGPEEIDGMPCVIIYDQEGLEEIKGESDFWSDEGGG